MRVFKSMVFLLPVLGLFSCNKPAENEWEILFNGKNLDGWEAKFFHHDLGDNYANTFRVIDSAIVVSYEDYDTFDNRYGHLFYKQPYESFHLKFKYKFTDEWMQDAPSYTYRNSGVMFHSQDPKTILKEQDWPISVEYQMLAEAEPGKPRPTGNMCSPGTDVFYKGQKSNDHCISSSSKTYTWDTWIEADLIVYKDSLVIHKVNGEQVLEYTKTQTGGEVANGFDPQYKVDGKPLTSGYIGLQAEGQGVIFKDIKLKKL
ncbi:DUF1080 domain-containing protein [Leeuwenhoekiella sp. MAR_2009_132]|uniref:3-keto-disaccharide hydrolase n=1 Tax=Leeuwenhoekiella sp. MAR_2009_132 TaxID=1392489 RepID=UPI000491F458|nr:DUF1080 domain-containing protein [Leeuwenhoekiella sp. MAR_2009_132]